MSQSTSYSQAAKKTTIPDASTSTNNQKPNRRVLGKSRLAFESQGSAMQHTSSAQAFVVPQATVTAILTPPLQAIQQPPATFASHDRSSSSFGLQLREVHDNILNNRLPTPPLGENEAGQSRQASSQTKIFTPPLSPTLPNAQVPELSNPSLVAVADCQQNLDTQPDPISLKKKCTKKPMRARHQFQGKEAKEWLSKKNEKESEHVQHIPFLLAASEVSYHHNSFAVNSLPSHPFVHVASTIQAASASSNTPKAITYASLFQQAVGSDNTQISGTASEGSSPSHLKSLAGAIGQVPVIAGQINGLASLVVVTANDTNSATPEITADTAVSSDNPVEIRWKARDNETWVTTKDGLREFLLRLKTIEEGQLEMFCDMEGYNLGKNGTISLLQVTLKSLQHTWIFDVTVLGKDVFNYTCTQGHSLRKYLESPRHPVAWFDCRNDTNALWFKFGVWLGGVVDIQLMELATREGCKMHRHGLARCIEEVARVTGKMTEEELAVFCGFKGKGKRHFGKGDDGYKEFDERPLTDMVMQYAGQDTIFMPMLYDHYFSKLRYAEFTYTALSKMAEAAADTSCTDGYDPQGVGHFYAPRTFWY